MTLTQSTVNIILQHANLVSSGGSGSHINILPLDATLEIGAENPQPPSKEKGGSKRSPALAGGITKEGLRSESGQQTPAESLPTGKPQRTQRVVGQILAMVPAKARAGGSVMLPAKTPQIVAKSSLCRKSRGARGFDWCAVDSARFPIS